MLDKSLVLGTIDSFSVLGQVFSFLKKVRF